MGKQFLFDESLYQFDEPQPSWWEESAAKPDLVGAELNSEVDCDVVIIGGGYTGLSAAYHLAKEYSIDVRVLEAGHIGWGSSGRNGGFCCMGGTQFSVEKSISKYGLEETRKFHTCQKDAVELVRALITDENIDADIQGDCEYVVAQKPSHYDALSKQCEFERETIGMDVSMVKQQEFAEVAYDAPHQHGAMAIRPGFGVHPLKYLHGLAVATERHGAKLHPHSEVLKWEKQTDKHIMRTAKGSVTAKHVIVACNGFMPEHLRESLNARILPLQSQIVVSRPLSDDELAAHNWKMQSQAVNSKNVYFYYRMLPGNRFMMGGRAEFSGTKKGAELTAQKLTDSVHQMWPEWKNVEMTHSWRGFVCFTSKLRPSIGRLPDDPTVHLGFGYHGNGVSNASWTGRELARWLATGNDKTNPLPMHLPAVVRGITPKFPFPSLSRTYARAGVAWHNFKDKMDGL